MPFDYSKKGVFGAKLATYMLVGFLAPFGACAYQLYVCLTCGFGIQELIFGLSSVFFFKVKVVVRA